MPKQEDYDDIADLLEEGELDGDDVLDGGKAASGDEIVLDDEDIEDGGEGDDTTDPDQQEGEEEGEGGDTPAGAAGDQGNGDEEIPDGQHPASVIRQPKPEENPFAVPENAKSRMDEITSELTKLDSDWDSGEINEAEFKKRMAELHAESADIAARVRADNLWRHRAAMEAQAADDKLWEGAVKGFKAANPALWSDAHRGRFNEHVKAVTGDARYDGMTYEQKLTLAGSFYSAERAALGEDAPKVVAAARKSGKPAAPDKRPPMPPTLGRRAAAAPNDASDGMFSELNRLEESGDVEAMEEAIMRMSPEAREKWLQGA